MWSDSKSTQDTAQSLLSYNSYKVYKQNWSCYYVFTSDIGKVNSSVFNIDVSLVKNRIATP